MRIIFTSVLLLFFVYQLSAQGQLSGDLQINANFYDRDSSIGAYTTQYLHEMSSAESWFTLNYELNDFKFSVRYDMFSNSPLLNPQESYTHQGIGFFQALKKVGDLEVTAGYFYDQFGSGIIFRAYEERLIGLDYAVRGVRVKYDFSDKFRVKGFVGQQKNRFDVWPQVMKGLNVEKDFIFNDHCSLLTGAAMLNRTLDEATMKQIAAIINSITFDVEKRFVPKYNVYAFTYYHTLNYKNLSWYLETAYKTSEAVKDPSGNLINSDGNVLYTSLNYSRKGFGLGVQYKRTSEFSLRTNPLYDPNTPLDGIMNFLPAMSKQNTKILPARYSISALDYGEQGYQADLTWSPNKTNTITGNFSYIVDLNNNDLYREIIFDYYRKHSSHFKTTFGIQTVLYNKKAYTNHLDTRNDGLLEPAIVKTIVPFSEFVIKLNDKKSLRAELQYMFTKQDFGDFLFALLEYNISPHYSFYGSDMVNTVPYKTPDVKHYYNIGMAYTLKQTRLMIGYMKQVSGVVCTGGVCRVEPAFSGIKFSLSTNF